MLRLKPILAFLSALTLCACGGNVPEPDPVKLAANPAELTFGPEGGTKQVAVTSGVQPTVTCQNDWVTVKAGAVSGNTYQYSVTAGAYNGLLDRSATVRVQADKQSVLVSVLQTHPVIALAVDRTSVSFDRKGGEVTLTVTSASQPTVKADASWIGLETGWMDKDHHTPVKISVGARRTTEAGAGTVTITCGSESATVAVSEEALVIPSAPATALTPQIVFDAMAPGWNMGNQMDAVSNNVADETVWGNPKCTQATMDGVKAAGFKAVRICTTWAGHIGSAPDYTVEKAWMDRVAEIVGYAEKAGLVAIVNTHHDENIWQDISKCYGDPAANETAMRMLFRVWTQIAERFKDKGEWLVFESLNEIQDGGWGWSDAFKKDPDAQYQVLNAWNQLFVNAVRATGGNNATRWLGVPGYAANPGFTIAGLVLPQDYTSANRLMVAVHDYDPYDYTLRDPLVRQWGHTAQSGLRPGGDNEKAVVGVFDNLKSAYLDKGIPVYLGEMGCSRHEAADFPYQKYYMEYFCKAAADRLLPMYLWDNGSRGTGSEKHAYIDHGTGQFADEDARTLVELMVKAVTTTDPSYTLQSVYDAAP